MEKILVVVDMQNDFVNGALGTKEAEGIVDYVVSKIKNFDGRIIVTMDTHGQDYLETAEGKKLPVPHCIRTTQGWLLNEKVFEALAEKNYKVIEKKTFGAKKLVKMLRSKKRRRGYGNRICGPVYGYLRGIQCAFNKDIFSGSQCQRRCKRLCGRYAAVTSGGA